MAIPPRLRGGLAERGIDASDETVWHGLSDVKLADALDDRASFRRLCGFAAAEPTPERTDFVRFRRALVRHELDREIIRVEDGNAAFLRLRG